jgi:hypothetical protein
MCVSAQFYRINTNVVTIKHQSQVKFIVSGPDREGEGEFKIFEHLNHMSTIQASDELALPSPYDPKDSILIVGGYVSTIDVSPER